MATLDPEFDRRLRALLTAGGEVGYAPQVASGYRSPGVNRAIGSSDSSDHIKAMAVDFKCPAYGTPKAVALHLSNKIDSLGIGQLIAEYGQWVHVSTRRPSKEINRVITINQSGTHAGIV